MSKHYTQSSCFAHPKLLKVFKEVHQRVIIPETCLSDCYCIVYGKDIKQHSTVYMSPMFTF